LRYYRCHLSVHYYFLFSSPLHEDPQLFELHWPRIKLLAIESTSAQNKEDCQEQTASLLNKEDKVQADSQVKTLLALANIHTFKDGDHTLFWWHNTIILSASCGVNVLLLSLVVSFSIISLLCKGDCGLKEDKVQADSQVKKLLALANIHTFKDGDHTQTVDDPTFGDKAQTATGIGF
jgi:primase-polymerase (primpol)-like protein